MLRKISDQYRNDQLTWHREIIVSVSPPTTYRKAKEKILDDLDRGVVTPIVKEWFLEAERDVNDEKYYLKIPNSIENELIETISVYVVSLNGVK